MSSLLGRWKKRLFDNRKQKEDLPQRVKLRIRLSVSYDCGEAHTMLLFYLLGIKSKNYGKKLLSSQF